MGITSGFHSTLARALLVVSVSGCTGAVRNDAGPADASDASTPVDGATSTRCEQAPVVPNEDVAPSCAPGEWCWEAPVPFANNLNAVWAPADDAAWVVGDHGFIAQSDGQRWTQRSSPTSATLSGIWGAVATDAWAWARSTPPQSGALLHWDGTRWNNATAAPQSGVELLTGSTESNVWAVAADDTGQSLVRWDGHAWQPSTFTLEPRDTITALCVRAPDDVWLVARKNNTLGLHHFDGASWSESRPELDANAALACPERGAVMVFLPGRFPMEGTSAPSRAFRTNGVTLTAVEAPSDALYFRVSAVSDNRWFMLSGGRGSSNTLWFWGGSRWVQHSSVVLQARSVSVAPSNSAAFAVAGSRIDAWRCDHWASSAAPWIDFASMSGAPSVGAQYVATSDGLYSREESGRWSKISSLQCGSRLWQSREGEAWCLGTGASLVHITQRTAQERTFARPLDAQYITGSAPDDIWFVSGTAAAVSRWNTRDAQPTSVAVPSSIDVGGVSISTAGTISAFDATGPNDLWIGLSHGALLHFDGAQWTAEELSGARFISKIARTPNGDLWLFNESGAMLRRAGSAEWTAIPSAQLLWPFVRHDGAVFAHNGAAVLRWNEATSRFDTLSSDTSWPGSRLGYVGDDDNIWTIAAHYGLRRLARP